MSVAPARSLILLAVCQKMCACMIAAWQTQKVMLSCPNLSQLRRLDVSDLGEAAYHSCVLSCDEEQHCRDAC